MLSYISLKVYTNFGTLPILFIKAFLHKILSEQNRCAIACQRHNTVFVLLLKRQLITSSKVFIIKLTHKTKYQESFIAYKNRIVIPLQGYFCKQFFLEFPQFYPHTPKTALLFMILSILVYTFFSRMFDLCCLL